MSTLLQHPQRCSLQHFSSHTHTPGRTRRRQRRCGASGGHRAGQKRHPRWPQLLVQAPSRGTTWRAGPGRRQARSPPAAQGEEKERRGTGARASSSLPSPLPHTCSFARRKRATSWRPSGGENLSLQQQEGGRRASMQRRRHGAAAAHFMSVGGVTPDPRLSTRDASAVSNSPSSGALRKVPTWLSSSSVWSAAAQRGRGTTSLGGGEAACAAAAATHLAGARPYRQRGGPRRPACAQSTCHRRGTRQRTARAAAAPRAGRPRPGRRQRGRRS